MTETMVHRGPDDSGLHVDGTIGLGFRRLSIVDLNTGAQPMANEDGSRWIVFNGEIYNHADLRPGLQAKGHEFRSRADTEVILHAYEEDPDGFITRLEGMFGFAVWDGANRRLTLGRDRMGIKPLYYARMGERFYFASEIKAILAALPALPEVNAADLAEFMHFGHLAGEATLFKDIHCLAPGSIATVDANGFRSRRYWSIPLLGAAGAEDSGDEILWMERAARAVDESLTQRFMADVPFGLMLSGGVDSSLLALRASRLRTERLDTYNITMPGHAFDESSYAREVSSLAGSVHHEVPADMDRALSLYSRMTWHHDEPLCFENGIWIYAVCDLAASKGEKILLSGEGADEVFAGYTRFKDNLSRFAACAGAPGLHALTARAAASTGADDLTPTLGFDEAMLLGSAVHSARKVVDLIGTADWQNPWRAEVLEACRKVDDPVKAMLAQDQAVRLGSLLSRMDKMGMAASVEVRVPFLDHRLVEAMAPVPVPLLLAGEPGSLETKVLLKKLAVASGVPSSAVYRPKVGLATPVSEWLKNPEGLGRYIQNLLDRQGRGLFNPKALNRLWAEHREGRAEHRVVLWNCAAFEMWAGHFLDNGQAGG